MLRATIQTNVLAVIVVTFNCSTAAYLFSKTLWPINSCHFMFLRIVYTCVCVLVCYTSLLSLLWSQHTCECQVGKQQYLYASISHMLWLKFNWAHYSQTNMQPLVCRYEFGSALFVGWAAASLTILGGSFLCCSCSNEDRRGQQYYRQSAPSTAREYV